MPVLHLSPLPDRGVLSITGPDSRNFLQGLISNDIHLVTPENAIYAALLTPQGKYLYDFFISQAGDRLLVDCEKERMADLAKRLRMYKLRADAAIADATEQYTISALWGDSAASTVGLAAQAGAAMETAGGTLYVDPRLATAGLRAVFDVDQSGPALATFTPTPATTDAYDIHRLKLGLPDASRDLVPEKSVLLESGFDDLNGINWEKGCYMGQELTARTKYRGLAKKRLTAVTIEGEMPTPGAAVMCGDKTAGEMRSSRGGFGLALLRLDHLQDPAGELTSENSTLRAVKPDWARF
ncbi:MAG: folate-binding protein YgfZ [Rhodospirillales bacterium]|nr:folate-binding protein YgfZ [Rhodospirillales bacterium]